MRKASKRRRWNDAWRAMWKGLLTGGLVWFLCLTLYKLFPVSIAILNWSGLVALCLPVLCFFVGFFRGRPIQETAQFIDNQERYHERLSTALEIGEQQANGKWGALVINDAFQYAKKLDLSKAIPFRVPALSRWVLVTLALGAGLGFVPEYRSDRFIQAEEEVENIKETGGYLQEFARRAVETRPPVLQETRDVMEDVEELGKHLSQAKLTRNEALKDIASVAEKVKKELASIGEDPGMKRLKKAAKLPASASGAAEGDQKKMDSMQKELGDAADQIETMEQMRKELNTLKAAAAGMQDASNDGGQLEKELAEALAEMAQKAKEAGVEIPNLDAAMKALKAGEIGQLLKEMEFATNDLEKLASMAKALKEMQIKNQQQGKDLAEQLEFGQAEQAASTLRKMAAKLDSGQLSQEEAKKMLSEVQKALKPAEAYGEVGELLKTAASQLKSDKKQGASQSMAEAAKKLDEMMQQFSDAQALNEQLKNLDIASMSIGNCQGWGQCKSKKIGWKQGGGMSPKGVGTWADQDDGTWRWLDYSQMQRVDNSGVQRPDMDSRGVSDRGAGQVPDGLIPDRIRGQFTPGGPMPSISLKGLSIKGTSKVEYTETVSAAQSQAQAALNQDQVPRAYRGAVRSYFDDLEQ
jgi:hypothetical protein